MLLKLIDISKINLINEKKALIFGITGQMVQFYHLYFLKKLCSPWNLEKINIQIY